MHLKSLVGADISSVNNIEEDYDWAISLGYSFVLADLYTKSERIFNEEGDGRINEINGLNFLSIKNTKVVNGVVGKISSWIDLDSTTEGIRKASEKALIEELEYAIFQGIPAVLIKLTKKTNHNLARVLSSFINREHFFFRIWISVPLEVEDELIEINDDNEICINTWEWWNEFSILMGEFISHFSVMIKLPKKINNVSIANQWCAEPIAAVETPSNIYLTNRHGHPVLSTEAQDILLRFFKLNCQVVVSGKVMNPRGYLSYFQYIAHLWKNRDPLSIYDRNSKEMEDHLQDPLQPLADHLPSSTYSIFELDPYKYAAYEKAIYQALCDIMDREGWKELCEEIEMISENGFENDTDKISYADVVSGDKNFEINNNHNGIEIQKYRNDEKIIIMVLGAGRGPLVDCALRASIDSKCDVTIYVVEKNPNAVVYLRNRLKTDWLENKSSIVLCPGDMRDLTLPDLAHVFVSELLGSFGDNELSPECLDGAQKFLRPNDGISIPTSYTSYIAPIQSTKLYQDMSSQQSNKNYKQSKFASLETPYVVNMKNFHRLCGVEEVFTFEHPKKNISDSNDRYKKIQFQLSKKCVIHGFAGYFHSVLYKDITMSIHPDWHSPDMFSWFPILFPLINPLQVQTNQEIDLHMWRVSNNKEVWYEWACTGQTQNTPIHNPGGRSYFISLLTK